MAAKRKPSNGASDEKDRQIQELNRRVAALEKELAAVRADKDRYQQQFDDWLRAVYPREAMERWAQEVVKEDCQPLEKFIGELEAIVHKRRKGA